MEKILKKSITALIWALVAGITLISRDTNTKMGSGPGNGTGQGIVGGGTVWGTGAFVLMASGSIHRHKRARYGNQLHGRSIIGRLDDDGRAGGMRFMPWPEWTRRQTQHGHECR